MRWQTPAADIHTQTTQHDVHHPPGSNHGKELCESFRLRMLHRPTCPRISEADWHTPYDAIPLHTTQSPKMSTFTHMPRHLCAHRVMATPLLGAYAFHHLRALKSNTTTTHQEDRPTLSTPMRPQFYTTPGTSPTLCNTHTHTSVKHTSPSQRANTDTGHCAVHKCKQTAGLLAPVVTGRTGQLTNGQ